MAFRISIKKKNSEVFVIVTHSPNVKTATCKEVVQEQLNPDITSQTGKFKHSNKTASLHANYGTAHIAKGTVTL